MAAGSGAAAGQGGGYWGGGLEWHPILSDYFVAGGDELQLYEVHRGPRRGEKGVASGLPQPRYVMQACLPHDTRKVS